MKKSHENTTDDLDNSGQIEESDLLSNTTSMHSSRYTASSRGIGKTFRSSKNRREHGRKFLRLKEGNPFEDIALIDALHNHIIKDSFDEIWTPEVMPTAQYVTGPNVDYAALQNGQRYSMIKPLKRFKPEPNIIDWQHEVLR